MLRALIVLMMASLGSGYAPQAAAVPAGRSFVWLVGGADADTAASRMPGQLRQAATSLRALNGAGTMRIKVAPSDAGTAGREPATELGEAQLAIARVYGVTHRPPGPRPSVYLRPAAATDADRLAALLERDFAAMTPNDRGLLVYSGQGQSDSSDRSNDALTLPDRSRMTVREVDHLATRAPVNAPLRFLFTQCQTAGFNRLIRPSAQDVRTLSPYSRCGFAADTPARKADACGSTAAPATGARPDYTSAFFSALSVHGTAGKVTLHDAHLQALLNSSEAERPTATSEAFLERWQPTWMRYLDTSSAPTDNEFGEAASALARKLGLPDTERALTTELRKQRLALDTRREQIHVALQQVGTDIGRLQRPIRQVLAQRWPLADDILQPTYGQIPQASLKEALAAIQAQPGYAELITRQEQRDALANEQRDAERRLAQLDKLVRLRQLARLQEQFERFADARARRDYERLSQCERAPL